MVPEFEFAPGEEQLHDRLLTYRNKLHAHSDSDFTNMELEIWRTPLPDGRSHDFLAARGGENLNFPEEEVQQIHRLLWKIRHHVDSALQDHPCSRDDLPVVNL